MSGTSTTSKWLADSTTTSSSFKDVALHNGYGFLTEGSRYTKNGSAGPRKSMYGSGATTRTVQGEVTINASVNKGVWDVRTRNTIDRPQARRIGACTKPSDLAIEEHEMVFTPSRVAQAKGGGRMANVCAISSFNGAATEESSTQEEFESKFSFVGRAKTHYEFNNPDVGNTGIAVQVRGACSIPLHSTVSIFPGDRLSWRLPSVDETTRVKELAVLHQQTRTDPDKLTAIVEPVTCAGTDRQIAEAIRQYAASNSPGIYTQERADPANAAGFDSKSRYAASMAQDALMSGLCLLSTLMELGVVTLNLPGNYTDPRENRELSTTVFAADPAVLARTRKTFAISRKASGGLDAVTTVDVGDEQADAFLQLAMHLGVVKPEGAWEISPRALVAKDAVLKSCRGDMNFKGGVKMSRDHNIARIGGEAALESSLGSKGGRGGGKSLWAKLERRQRQARQHMRMAEYDVRAAADRKVFGTALSYSCPGEWADVVI